MGRGSLDGKVSLVHFLQRIRNDTTRYKSKGSPARSEYFNSVVVHALSSYSILWEVSMDDPRWQSASSCAEASPLRTKDGRARNFDSLYKRSVLDHVQASSVEAQTTPARLLNTMNVLGRPADGIRQSFRARTIIARKRKHQACAATSQTAENPPLKKHAHTKSHPCTQTNGQRNKQTDKQKNKRKQTDIQ